MLISVISFAVIVPYTLLGKFFGFVPPPPAFYLALAGILGAYAVLAETVKRAFYKRYGNRVEQVLVPKRKTIYSSRTAKLVQDMISVISLRVEDEISIDSLTEDLSDTLNYPFTSDHVVRNLQYLHRSGLVNVNWQKRTIKREASLSEYVKKNVIASETWGALSEAWRKKSSFILSKHKAVNKEYENYLGEDKEKQGIT
jgi:hypothetical protein